jgi:hypothetical protein
MDDPALKREMERLWNGMRRAFADYRLEEVSKFADVPAGMPVPPREQVEQFIGFLPDLAKTEFIRIVRERDRAGYYARVKSTGPRGAEVLVIRFRESGGAWKVVGAPDSFSSYSNDRAGPAEAAEWVESEPSLRLFPSP